MTRQLDHEQRELLSRLKQEIPRLQRKAEAAEFALTHARAMATHAHRELNELLVAVEGIESGDMSFEDFVEGRFITQKQHDDFVEDRF